MNVVLQTWQTEQNALSHWLDTERAKLAKLWNALIWEPAQMADIKAEAQQGMQRMRQQQIKLTQLQLKHR